ncbi:MAG: ferrous iron transport protein A [Lachnospiraceae bacterium]|nr:ferrous iron transport protein A [Lachnospiraceae bacterium]
MKNLTELSQGQKAKIVAINGDKRYLTRVTSIGLSIGCQVEMLQNFVFGVKTLRVSEA